jgi:peptidoglycan LD-endopeptidase LytH
MVHKAGPFHPVMTIPTGTRVVDLSNPSKPVADSEIEQMGFAIGRYAEHRPTTYTTALFEGRRNIHVGIDLFGPAGSAVHAFADGRVHLFGYNEAPGDYGHTIITHHVLDGLELFALHGHLSARSTQSLRQGQELRRGEVFAWTGERSENGGWVPHLHFQLSYERPQKPDLPGAVAAEDLTLALLKYPDPRLVLGAIY